MIIGRENLAVNQHTGKIKTPCEESPSKVGATAPPANIFEESLKLGDCVKIFVNVM